MKDILVVGECCYDTFIYGDCDRMSPEAPVPVFLPKSESRNLGMAGNVYTNLSSMSLPEENVELLSSPDWTEVNKVRYVDDRTNHMFLRVDYNDKNFERVDVSQIDYNSYAAIVISDYNKGVLSKEDITYISKHHHLTFLDTKKRLGEWASNISFIKLNTHESKYNVPDSFANKISHKLISTHGPDGCFFKGKTYPVDRVNIKDVSGAGDTFLAALVYSYLKSKDIEKAIVEANLCATEVVQQRGVTLPK
tara:strand:+ start:5193 stop:5942 length:750 start_codon:yes stop_codon:yes gene_type:complete